MRKMFFILILPCHLFSQTTYFNIQFDYGNIWNASSSVSEIDDFYLSCGGFGSPWTLDTSYILLIQKNGEVLSLRKTDFFPGSKAFDISAYPGSPGEFDLSGRMNHNGFDDVVNSDLFLARFSLPGFDTVRVRTFGVPGFGDYTNSPMLRTSDNGTVLTGYRFNYDTPGQWLILLKTDSLLNQVFLKTYKKVSNQNHFGYGTVETPDKGFIVVGARSFNQYYRQGTYLRTDSLGNLLWWKDIVPQGDEELIVLTAITGLDNGTFLVTGIKNYFTPGFPRYRVQMILNINAEGDILWSKEFGSDIYEDTAWRGLDRCPDGNFITAGTKRENYNVPGQKAYGTIAKITPAGDVLWERKYSVSTEGKFYDSFWRTIPTSDGGFIACGSTWGDSIVKENSWIVKLDSLGCLEPGCAGITGVMELPVGGNSPVRIYPNPTGGPLTVEALGGRRITALKVYDLHGRILKDEVFAPAREALSFDISGAPPGTYFCTALVGGVWVTRQVVKH